MTIPLRHAPFFMCEIPLHTKILVKINVNSALAGL